MSTILNLLPLINPAKELLGQKIYPSQKIIIELVSNYVLAEKRLNQEAVIASEQPFMGSVTDWQRAAKAHLKHDTNDATNHGPEVNNPFPEPLKEGKYIAHMPDGTVIILKNEQEICDFIDEQRRQGFPLGVNPKWGWIKTKSGHLTIPAQRFDWNAVHEEINKLQAEVNSLESVLHKLLRDNRIEASEPNISHLSNFITESEVVSGKQEANISLINLEGNKEEFDLTDDFTKNFLELYGKLTNRLRTLTEESDIIHCKLKIEKLRLEPDIIYSGEREAIDETKQQIIAAIREKERKEREIQIQRLSELLENKIKKLYENMGVISIISQIQDKLDESIAASIRNFKLGDKTYKRYYAQNKGGFFHSPLPVAPDNSLPKDKQTEEIDPKRRKKY